MDDIELELRPEIKPCEHERTAYDTAVTEDGDARVRFCRLCGIALQ